MYSIKKRINKREKVTKTEQIATRNDNNQIVFYIFVPGIKMHCFLSYFEGD